MGIIVFMGLVAFGTIFIGAAAALLTDADYRSLGLALGRARTLRIPVWGRRWQPEVLG